MSSALTWLVDEGGVDRDVLLEALARHFGERKSFMLLPSRLGVSDTWLRERLSALPDDVAEGGCFLLLTSGSTGVPKLVVASMERAERMAEAIHRAQDLEAVRRTIVALPFAYCYAFVNQYVWARQMKRDLVVTAGVNDLDAYLDTLSEASEAMLCLVRAQVPLLLGAAAGRRFEGVLRVNFAGGPFPLGHLGALRALFPNAVIYNNYGCTEAMPRLTVTRVEDTYDGVLGDALSGVSLRLSSEDELEFQSPYAILGSIDAQGFHASPDWMGTGDIAEAVSGSFRLKGRRGEVFKRYGEKLSLPAMLDVIQSLSGSVCAGYREVDVRGEPGWVLVLEGAPSSEIVRTILLTLRKRFRRPHWPLRIESAETLPRTASGKVDGVGLSALAGSSGRDEILNTHWKLRL